MKKNIINIILIFIMLLAVIFHFLVTQTDYIEQIFGIKLNKKEVVVVKENIYKGDKITEDKIAIDYVDIDFIIEGALTDVNQARNFIATQDIYEKEQISKNKIESEEKDKNPKKLIYSISVNNLTAIGNFLYVGDSVMLWYVHNGKTGKVFDDSIEIVALRDKSGNAVNYNKSQPTSMPNSVIIRVDEDDIKKLEEYSSQGKKFFFVKEI